MLHQEAKKVFQMHLMNTNIKVEDVVNGFGWPKRERGICRGLFTALSVNKVWNQDGLWLKTTNRLIFARWIQLSNARLTHWPHPKDIMYFIFKAQLHVTWWPTRISMLSYFWTEAFKRREASDLWEGVIYACTHVLIYYLSWSKVKSYKGAHGGK